MLRTITLSLILSLVTLQSAIANEAMTPESNVNNWIAERGLEDKGARFEACKAQADGSAVCRIHQYTQRGTVIVHELSCRPQSGCKSTNQFEKTY